MIVVDTSALIAIVRREPEAELCVAALANAAEVLIFAPTLTEALIVAGGKGLLDRLVALLQTLDLEVVALDGNDARQAADAYRIWGREYHAAKLNFGDSFAYSLAKSRNCPLLYIGNDFSKTDIVSALA